MQRFSKSFSLLLLAGLLAAGCSRSVESGAVDQSTSQDPFQQQRFDGVTITVTGLRYPIGNAFESHAKKFEDATGAKVVFETVPFGDLYETIEADFKTGEGRYDLVIYPPIWLSDMVKADYLSDLSSSNGRVHL